MTRTGKPENTKEGMERFPFSEGTPLSNINIQGCGGASCTCVFHFDRGLPTRNRRWPTHRRSKHKSKQRCVNQKHAPATGWRTNGTHKKNKKHNHEQQDTHDNNKTDKSNNNKDKSNNNRDKSNNTTNNKSNANNNIATTTSPSTPT